MRQHIHYLEVNPKERHFAQVQVIVYNVFHFNLFCGSCTNIKYKTFTFYWQCSGYSYHVSVRKMICLAWGRQPTPSPLSV